MRVREDDRVTIAITATDGNDEFYSVHDVTRARYEDVKYQERLIRRITAEPIRGTVKVRFWGYIGTDEKSHLKVEANRFFEGTPMVCVSEILRDIQYYFIVLSGIEE